MSKYEPIDTIELGQKYKLACQEYVTVIKLSKSNFYCKFIHNNTIVAYDNETCLPINGNMKLRLLNRVN